MTARINRLLMLAIAVLAVMAFLTASVGDAQAGKWKRKSKQHEDDCNAWCDAREECDHCSTLLNCGPGFDTIQSWTGYGKNWHACKRRPTRDEAGKKNRDDCNAWCQRNEDCKKCESVYRCRDGYETLKTFGGRGTNYYACGLKRYNTAASNYNRDECFKWCDENKPLCRTCYTYKGCSAGKVAIKSWKGKGRNFYACARRDDVKAHNKAACDAWCAEHDKCVKCDTKKACGYGYLHMKSFKMGNSSSDYHACKRRDSAWGTIGTE